MLSSNASNVQDAPRTGSLQLIARGVCSSRRRRHDEGETLEAMQGTAMHGSTCSVLTVAQAGCRELLCHQLDVASYSATNWKATAPNPTSPTREEVDVPRVIGC